MPANVLTVTRRAYVSIAIGVALVAAGCGSSQAATTASTAVLGSAVFAGPNGEGWGTVRPAKVYNGGDASGQIREIHWTSWGGKTAIGYGLNAIFKPHGGYYPQPVIVEVRASGLGKCTSDGPPAYTHLSVRSPTKPDGPLGAWHAWEYSPSKGLCEFGF